MSASTRMDEDNDDAAARAYASIAAQLEQFTSPQLGKSSHLSSDSSGMYRGDMMTMDDDELDEMDWMEQDLVTLPPPRQTPRRTPILERASTPVISNSSSKKEKERPSPIKSPPVVIPRPMVSSPRRVVPTMGHQSSFVYRQYHDILLSYLKAKRSLSQSLELEQQGQALEPMTLGPAISSLSSREQRTELDFLSQLQQLCWSSTFSLEGDCWLLLFSLRQLGLPALIWDNDPTSQAQNTRAVHGFIQQTSCLTGETPEVVLQRLASKDAPLALQRRYTILQWIRTCLDQDRTEPPPKLFVQPTSTSHPDDPSVVPEETYLEAALGMILAGKVEDAQDLARKQGQPWRAAVWKGGKPQGIKKVPNTHTQKVDALMTGNPHRFLWKRQMFLTARQAAPLEAAISAVLANDLSTCLANPHLRNWSKALCATFTCIWGRLEDELLIQHNTQRRKESLPYEGTEYEDKEQEQLFATSQMSNMNEDQALNLLNNSPFAELKGDDVFQRATGAFLKGKLSVLEYCKQETIFVFREDDDDAQVAHLRFLTHLTLFLDSLEVSSTPIELQGLTQQKNQVLFQYVLYLESRPELWPLTTLYVSLLPEPKRLSWFPSLLAKVLDETERESFVLSMQELFPQDILPILQQTVRLVLNSHAAPDEHKIRALYWLLMDETHADEAVICSNLLLRDFFSVEDDKLDLAMELIDNLPDEIATHIRSSDVRMEHLAYVAFLEAYQAFGQWKEIISDTPSTTDDIVGIELKNLTDVEKEIARHRIIRDWTKQKRKHCEAVIDAAEEARVAILRVLTHPGGWLASDDDDNSMEGDEELKRRRDMQSIQSRYLVLAINLYHQVCESTASWISQSLDNASSLMSRSEAMESLQHPLYRPENWYQCALDVSIILADDRYNIYKAIGQNALKDFLAKLGETAVAKLMG